MNEFKYPIKIVNLEKRVDRKNATIAELENAHIADYEFIKAVNGAELQPTFNLGKLFAGNCWGYRRGVIGCALSHLNLWSQLVNDPDTDYYIILEDDITLCKDFKEKLSQLKPQLIENELLFLGYHMWSQQRNMVKHIYENNNSEIKHKLLEKQLYIGGTFAYSINKKGAQLLIDYIASNGIKYAIDNLMVGGVKNINVYECYPQLIFSEWNEHGTADTDIQNDHTSLF